MLAVMHACGDHGGDTLQGTLAANSYFFRLALYSELTFPRRFCFFV